MIIMMTEMIIMVMIIMMMTVFTYDAVLDQPYISVPKTSEFKSGPRVVNIAKGTTDPRIEFILPK